MPTMRQVIEEWLDERVQAIDPSLDEIAMHIEHMLVEHSCCDTQTFQFTTEGNLYQKVLEATSE